MATPAAIPTAATSSLLHPMMLAAPVNVAPCVFVAELKVPLVVGATVTLANVVALAVEVAATICPSLD